MSANAITLCRPLLAVAVIGLFGLHLYLDIVLIATIVLIFSLDAVDGDVARKRKQTTDFGATLDIVADRIVENTFWIYFTAIGLIPFSIPVIVISRGVLTDELRRTSPTPESVNPMMSSRWTHVLSLSRASRCLYGMVKMLTFLYLGGVSALKNSGHELGIENLERIGVLLSGITVTMCLIRGLPILIEGWKAIQDEFSDEPS